MELGTPLSVIQRICGHESVATTQRYVHVNGAQRQRAVDGLGEAWSQRRGELRARETVVPDDGAA